MGTGKGVMFEPRLSVTLARTAVTQHLTGSNSREPLCHVGGHVNGAGTWSTGPGRHSTVGDRAGIIARVEQLVLQTHAIE